LIVFTVLNITGGRFRVGGTQSLPSAMRARERRAGCACRILAAGVLPLAFGLWARPVHGGGRLLVTLGDVTATTVILWARSEVGGDLVAEFAAPTSAKTVRAIVRTRGDRDYTGKVVVRGLEPATAYRYRLSRGTETVDGRFVTAPGDPEARAVVFTWSGDLGGGKQCRRTGSGYPVFRAMASRRPDFFLFVGDTVYADHRCAGRNVVSDADFKARSLSEFYRKHRYNREDLAVQDFFRETSVYPIWDDHDVRNNFAASTEPLAPIGLRAFLDYWPITPPEDDPTRLYRQFRWGRLLEVFILDTRQYRSPKCLDNAEKTMLGAAQRKWLVDSVARSQAVWKVVVSTVSFSIAKGGPCGDSWAPRTFLWLRTGFVTERDAILRALHERGVKNLIVVAADVHYADLIRHRPAPAFGFHEFTAGPLAATPKEPENIDAALGPERLFAQGGLNNFGEIAVDQTALAVRIIDEHGRILVTRTIEAER
jgi:alkaline phosphatase D